MTRADSRAGPVRETGSGVGPTEVAEGPTRAGFVAILGAPNAGKSTLLNALIGEPLSIVTPKAQTTRTRVTGILTRAGFQAIFLDTPGLLKARNLLQQSMLGSAQEAVEDADLALLVVDPTTNADRRAEALTALGSLMDGCRRPFVTVLTKADLAAAVRIDAARRAVEEALEAAPLVVSGTSGQGIEELERTLGALLPESPFLYPEDELSTQSVRFFVAELVRETVFEQFRDEIPYAVHARVEDFRETQEPAYIHVILYVERNSQKRILIGEGGRSIRELGTAARAKVESLLGRDVYLELWVKVLPGWRRTRDLLGRLGFRVPSEHDRPPI